jgi:murein DD-endopeptidase MepM/ murein hydrolase activator NlpD
MLNQRYMLVIADATGRPMRRFKVTPRAWLSLAVPLGVLLLAILAVLGHLWVLREQSSLAQGVRNENAMLARLTQRLENRLPVIQKLARTTESTFDQVWSKSSLGRDPTLLPEHVPLEHPVPHADADSESTPAPRPAEDFASAQDFATLPDNLGDLEHHILRLQGTLGETLEYYHDAAQLLANTPSIRPTRSPWLSSSFGKRIDPIYGYWVMHKGLDMPGHIGMEVMAPADGVIIWTGWRGGYGQTVVIDHGYGLQTHFAHLSAYLVEPGMHVRRGDPVARMGSTGKSTGPHLHYEVRRLGQPMDPRRFILD